MIVDEGHANQEIAFCVLLCCYVTLLNLNGDSDQFEFGLG